jgi:hypothetical protein
MTSQNGVENTPNWCGLLETETLMTSNINVNYANMERK